MNPNRYDNIVTYYQGACSKTVYIKDRQLGLYDIINDLNKGLSKTDVASNYSLQEEVVDEVIKFDENNLIIYEQNPNIPTNLIVGDTMGNYHKGMGAVSQVRAIIDRIGHFGKCMHCGEEYVKIYMNINDEIPDEALSNAKDDDMFLCATNDWTYAHEK